jgi:hypothetical protein
MKRTQLKRYTPIRQVSRKRARQNRERRAMATRRYGPDRPLCAWPGDTPHWADAFHEPLTRARGGSITDEENTVPMCNLHNSMLTTLTGARLREAYDLGLIKHSWGAA